MKHDSLNIDNLISKLVIDNFLLEKLNSLFFFYNIIKNKIINNNNITLINKT